ncbi:MAG: universal stress protein [Hymenobacteraceae bacterium]|nr:universal stress protein [Hymenobacteraceae bacterium]
MLVAVDADAFTLNAATRALTPLLGAWSAAYSVVHVTARDDSPGLQGQLALNHLRASGLLPATVPLELYEAPSVEPAAGVLATLDDTRADLLVLIARPRSFLGQLFHRSVTAHILRGCWVPVLLLPAEA